MRAERRGEGYSWTSSVSGPFLPDLGDAYLRMITGYIPSSVMIPQRRFATLLEQARGYQQSQCLYHNVPPKSRSYSLYTDHLCDRNAFPRVTTAVLEVHSDEVWNLEWSHSGRYLATASRDKTAIIWRIEVRRSVPLR